MAEVVNTDGHRTAAERSTAELVQLATEQLSRLIRNELALARTELAEKRRQVGIGAGLFGGSGVLTFYGLGALIAATVALLAVVVPAWVAALVVAVALFLLAGVLALTGRQRVRRAVPAVPVAAVDSVRADVDAVTAAVRNRGRA